MSRFYTCKVKRLLEKETDERDGKRLFFYVQIFKLECLRFYVSKDFNY